MKKIFTYILAVLATLLIFAVNSYAGDGPDNPDGLVLDKSVTKTPDSNGYYWLTLDSYVTGSIRMVTEMHPIDVILVLDTSSSLVDSFGSGNRLKPLQRAACAFLDNLQKYYVDGGAGDIARVGVITFASGAKKIVFDDLVYANADNVSALKTDINLYHAGRKDTDKDPEHLLGDYTDIHTGMGLAKEWINSIVDTQDRKSKKYVIVFTDGEPGGADGKIWVAREAVDNALEIKKTAEIFSIGCMSSTKENMYIKANGGSSDQEYKNTSISETEFLQRMSSNYPKAYFTCDNSKSLNTQRVVNLRKYDWDTEAPSPHPDYYQKASQDGSNLESIFEGISHVIGGASIEVNAYSRVDDIVTDTFSIPGGTTNIQVYTIPYVGESTWGTPTAFTDANISCTAKDDGTTLVRVTNFDFSKNWCGYQEVEKQYRGNKLRLMIPIIVKDGKDGGLEIPTNGPASGIYIMNDKGEYEKLGSYPEPDIDLPIAITIQKTGLAKAESAIFTVSKIVDKSSEKITSVILTGNGSGTPSVTVKGLTPGCSYEVKENDSWSWTYKPVEPQTKKCDISTTFTFANEKKTDVTVKNAEADVKNDFKSGTATSVSK